MPDWVDEKGTKPDGFFSLVVLEAPALSGSPGPPLLRFFDESSSLTPLFVIPPGVDGVAVLGAVEEAPDQQLRRSLEKDLARSTITFFVFESRQEANCSVTDNAEIASGLPNDASDLETLQQDQSARPAPKSGPVDSRDGEGRGQRLNPADQPAVDEDLR